MQYFVKNELKENVQCLVYSLIKFVLNMMFIVKDDCIFLFCVFNENEYFLKFIGQNICKILMWCFRLIYKKNRGDYLEWRYSFLYIFDVIGNILFLIWVGKLLSY